MANPPEDKTPTRVWVVCDENGYLTTTLSPESFRTELCRAHGLVVHEFSRDDARSSIVANLKKYAEERKELVYDARIINRLIFLIEKGML